MAKLAAFSEREKIIAQGGDPDADNALHDSADTAVVADEQIDPGTDADLDLGGDTEVADDTQDDDVAGSWVTDDRKALAESYELDPADFDSAEAFDKFAALYEAKIAKLAGTVTEAKKEEAATEAQKEVDADDLDLEAYRKKWGEDPESLKVVETLKNERTKRKDLEQRLGKIEQSYQAAEEQRRVEQWNHMFHTTVDQLDEKLFGRAFKDGQAQDIDKVALENRKKLHDAAETIASGIAARAKAEGKEPKPLPLNVLLARARDMAFSKEVAAEQKRKIQADASKQGSRRRPVAASRPTRPQASPAKAQAVDIKAIANSPDIVKAWNKMQEANGTE